MAIFIVGFGLLWIVAYHLRPFPIRAHDWSSEILLPALLAQQLSTYARSRFWNVALN